jgi:hypothetical protein
MGAPRLDRADRSRQTANASTEFYRAIAVAAVSVAIASGGQPALEDRGVEIFGLTIVSDSPRGTRSAGGQRGRGFDGRMIG